MFRYSSEDDTNPDAPLLRAYVACQNAASIDSREDLERMQHLYDFDSDLGSEIGELKRALEEDGLPLHEKTLTAQPWTGAEYAVPARVKLLYFAVYFLLSFSLVLYNKFVLGEFRYPFLITAWHCTCSLIGCLGLIATGKLRLTKLNLREHGVLVGFSLLYTANIAASTTSLSLVSVPFHELLRSTGPACTVLVYRVALFRSFSGPTYLSLVPMIAGVGIATYGNYHYTPFSFTVGVIGVLLAAVKGIASNRIMTGSLALPPMELLFRMAPLAAVQSLIYSAASGEMRRAIEFSFEDHFTKFLLVALIFNGVFAFFLNIASFSTNKMAGALTIAVGGNIKQVFTIIIGLVLWHVEISLVNAVGMLVTLSGALLYTRAEIGVRKQ